MADKRISDFNTLQSAQGTDLILVSSNSQTFNMTIETFQNATSEAAIASVSTQAAEIVAQATADADASADIAASAATLAQSSAQSAARDAATASSAADTASGAALVANGAADAADASKTAAATSAGNAATSAASAASSESNAASASAAASDAADAANGSEMVARGAAEAAQAVLESIPADYSALTSDVELLKDNVSAGYITPDLNVTSQGVTFTYDAEHNAIKAYGTAALNRYLLCLNGQNAIAITSTALIQTFEADTYDFTVVVSGHYSGKVTWRYTYDTFPGSDLVDSVDNSSARITFTGPAMVGLLMPKNAEYGTEEDPTYIRLTATRLSAVDDVARNAIADMQAMIDGLTVAESTIWN